MMDNQIIDRIKEFSTLSHFSQEEAIYLPYEPSKSLYLIKSGRVKLSYTNGIGRRKLTMVTLGSGELFGEMALLGETYRELKAEALEDSNIWIISRDTFVDLAEKNPLLLHNVLKLFLRRLSQVRRKLTELAFKDLETRLSRILLNLMREFGEKTEKGVEIRVKITHQEIAELIGCTRTSVTTCLTHFEDEGILTKGKCHVIIKDKRRLEYKATKDGEG